MSRLRLLVVQFAIVIGLITLVVAVLTNLLRFRDVVSK